MPLEPDVALAVVVGPHGLLLIERTDYTPPLAFPGGKIEPGESAEQAAARETLEETAVRVVCTGVLAERSHPSTGMPIAYIAAHPVDDGDPVPSAREATMAAWWPLQKAFAALGPLLHPAVRAYLADLMT